MKIRGFFPVMAAVFLCGLTGVQADDTNAVIARGTGIEIKRSDLDDALAAYKTQIQMLTSAQALLFQRQTLTNLINNRLLLAKATDEDKPAGKKTADLQITAAIENVGSQEEFDQLLKTNGLTEDGLRAKRTD